MLITHIVVGIVLVVCYQKERLSMNTGNAQNAIEAGNNHTKQNPAEAGDC